MIKITLASENPEKFKQVVARAKKARERTEEKIKKSGLPFSAFGLVVDGDKVKGMDVAD